MKFFSREEWQEPFDELVAMHLMPSCEAAGIDPDALADAIGEHRAAVIWGCLVEDFLAADLEDGSNIVDAYLKRRGWKETASNKQYLKSLRSSVMSLYEVSDIVRDQSFLARDLLRGGEPVRVSEKSGTHSLRQWDRIAARVVRVGPKFEMAGGALPFGRELSEVIISGFGELKEETRSDVRKLARERPGDVKDEELVLNTEILRRGAFLFTNAWLNDVLERERNPRLPTIVNGDGDEIAFTTVRYPLKGAADRKTLEAVLTAIPALHRASENHWNWIAPASRKKHAAAEGAQIFVTTFEDGSVSMGDIELDAAALELETNSPQRAQKGRALLDPIIGPFVEEPVVESRTMAEMMASRPAGEREAPSSGLSPEEESTIVRDALDSHYRGVLDEPVPMLGNVSPRKAAKTKKGREKLVDWLKLLENEAGRQDTHSPTAGYDVSWMWEELGVSDLRR